MVAIQMATVNTAEHFGLSKEIGMIAPGRWADILLAESLSEVRPSTVIAKGQIVAQEGKLTLPPPSFDYPAWTRNSVHLKRPLRAGDFVLRAPGGGGRHLAHVIGVVENQLPTQHLLLPIDSHSGEVRTDIGRDLAKVALVQRHKGMSGTTLGLVQGFGFTEKCAAASTVAHDCHQLLVVGTDEDCMARAVSELAKNGGGQVVVKDGKVVGMVALSIAGLMSTSRAEDVAASARTVLDGFRECGCRINNPNIPLSFLALATIPALRITDMGLVDVERHQVIPVLEEA
jgi:adenine deaminase